MAQTKGLYKRGSKYWIRYAGLDGKIIRESSGSDKYREAETLLIRRRQMIKEGNQPEIKRILNHSFRELAAEYMKWMERQRGYKQKVSVINLLVSTFGQYPLRRFDTRLMEQYQSDMLVKGKKNATANRH